MPSSILCTYVHGLFIRAHGHPVTSTPPSSLDISPVPTIRLPLSSRLSYGGMILITK